MIPSMRTRWGPLPAWIWVLGLALVPLGLAPQGYVGMENDDALYVLAARALSEGHYRLWFLPGAARLTNATPGFPALLLPAEWIGGEGWLWHQLLSALFLAMAVVLVGRWAQRRFAPGLALALTALFALNPLVLSRTGIVMPEPAFLLITLLILENLNRSGIVVGSGLLAAYLVRPAALPLWLAVWAQAALRRKWSQLPGAVLIPLAGLAAWTLWCRPGGGVQEAREWSVFHDSVHLGRLALANASAFMAAWGQTVLPLPWARGSAALWTGGLLSGLMILGLIRGFRRDPADSARLFLAGSLVMHLFWPWWYERYLIPLLPFLWATLLEAFPSVKEPRVGQRAAIGLGLTAGLIFLSQGIPLIRSSESRRRPALRDTYAWIQAHTTVADGFASALATRDLIHTGRVFQPLPAASTSLEWFQQLERGRIRFILWEDCLELGFSERVNPVAQSLQRNGIWLAERQSFHPVFRNDAEGATLYERLSPGNVSSP